MKLWYANKIPIENNKPTAERKRYVDKSPVSKNLLQNLPRFKIRVIKFNIEESIRDSPLPNCKYFPIVSNIGSEITEPGIETS